MDMYLILLGLRACEGVIDCAFIVVTRDTLY